ncbi:MAG: hypothetical protein KA419_03650 [Acidobacteria bacterium]|nr:hypothetical protein [Acidobacteriota bacterium]
MLSFDFEQTSTRGTLIIPAPVIPDDLEEFRRVLLHAVTRCEHLTVFLESPEGLPPEARDLLTACRRQMALVGKGLVVRQRAADLQGLAAVSC